LKNSKSKRTIIFGDAHGCIDQIHALMDAVGVALDDDVYSLGDFVDRGPDSPGCYEFVRKRKSIKGNHEHKHVRFKDGVLKQLSPSQIGARAQFLQKGGQAYYDEAVEFMRTLPFYVELPEAILVHAGLEYGIPMEDQHPIVLCGGMSMGHITGVDPRTGMPYWCARYPKHAKPVVWGHLSVGDQLPMNGNLFPIDTGCYAGNTLTALVLPEFKIYQVPGYQR